MLTQPPGVERMNNRVRLNSDFTERTAVIVTVTDGIESSVEISFEELFAITDSVKSTIDLNESKRNG